MNRCLSALLVMFASVMAVNPAAAAVHQKTFAVPHVDGVDSMRYGISVPDDYKPGEPRPLVLALHPGGDRPAFYGSTYLIRFFMPALKGLSAIMVAPDCPTRTWTDAGAEQAVMALLDAVMGEYAIDRRKVLVTGYSMGGRGTWFMASRHSDFFTGAIPIAGTPEGQPLESLGKIPTYVIHSRTDEVVPPGPDQRAAAALEAQGRPVKLEIVEGGGHFDTGSYMAAFLRAVGWVSARW
jgi:predicted peptidase